MAISVRYVAKETGVNLLRNRMMALAAVLTVAVSLSLVGAALLLRQAAASEVVQWAGNVSLQIFVNPTATPAQAASVESMISQTPQIQHAKYLDKAESYALMKQVLASDPQAWEAVTVDEVPPVYQCTLVNPNDAAAVAAIFKGRPGVYNVTYPGQSIRTMEEVTGVIQKILLAIALVLVVSSLVLILNAVRMAIFARRREVGVMKLVGATNWFIRIPFMLEGFVQGLVGAIVAVFVVLLANIGVRYLVDHYKVTVLSSTVLSARDVFLTEIVVVLIGIAVGVAGSFVAIRRFLDV